MSKGDVLLRIAFALLGSGVLLTLFLREDEEGRIQNRLEELWIRIDDAQSAALSRQAAFVAEIARVVTRILDRIFGERLFSAHAASVSAFYGLASSILFSLFLKFINGGRP